VDSVGELRSVSCHVVVTLEKIVEAKWSLKIIQQNTCIYPVPDQWPNYLLLPPWCRLSEIIHNTMLWFNSKNVLGVGQPQRMLLYISFLR
jgi:hypothetical protein